MSFSQSDVSNLLSEEECFNLAQDDLMGFTQVVMPDYKPGQFHVELAENLEKVESGEIERLAVSAPPGHGKPVSVNSEILMGDGTQKKLKGVEAGDYVITHEGRPREIREVHEQGVLDVIKIKTYCGRKIELAPDHPVLTPRGFVQSGQLEEDMRVAALNGYKTKSKTERCIDEYKVAGYMIGDGCTTHSNFSFTNTDPEISKDFETSCNRMGFSVKYDKNKKSRHRVKAKDRKRKRKWSPQKWKRNASIVGNSHTKRIPDWVFEGNEEQISTFLGAYFAADGSVNKKGKERDDLCCELYSVNYELLRQSQQLLERIGVNSSIRKKSGRYNGNRHQSYRLTITSKNETAKFKNRVRVVGKKLNRLQDWRVTRTQFDPPYFADKIESIEESGQSECRCLTVEEDSTFIADSIVVHNSCLCSIMFPIWSLGRDPTRRIIQSSYSSDLSEDFSMKARDRVWNDEVYREIFPNCKIDPGKRGKSQWHLTEGGYYLATGTGGSCTGKRAEILLIDDPHKDWEKAHSPREKEKVWNWFQSTASSRLTKDGRIVLIQTRWAHDDLIGRIKETNPEDWKFINYPAIDENNEPLCPHMFPLENLKKKKENTPLRIWLSLYQGMPVKGEGAEMDMDMFNRVQEDEVPDDCKWVRGWDLAFTTGRNSARTASVKVGKDKETGEYYLKDYIRGKWKWDEVKNLVVDTAKQEGCILAIGAGGTQVKEFEQIQEELKGHLPTSAVKKIPERGDKKARIRQWAAKVETGNFNLVNDGSNWENFLYEAHHFPDGKYDDSLDAVSDAYEELNEQTGANATGLASPTQIRKKSKWQT